MRTTVDIPDDLYGKARKLAAARGQKIGALITEGLQKLVVARGPHPRTKGGKSGKTRRPALPPTAAQWLRQWRALSKPSPASGSRKPSAAETVSRLRR